MKRDAFHGIVRNAIANFQKSVSCYDTDINQSVMNFATGLELTLKARLHHEHWTLLLEDMDRTKQAQLESFGFISVSMNKLLTRMQLIFPSDFKSEVVKSFGPITKIRNQTMHCYSPDMADDIRREDIARAQLLAWHHLYDLIDNQWSVVFKKHLDDFFSLDNEFRKNPARLKNVFEATEAIREPFRKRRIKIWKCGVCSYKSKRPEDNPYSQVVMSYYCDVCRSMDIHVNLRCDSCKHDNHFVIESLGFLPPEFKCGKCLRRIPHEHLIQQYVDSIAQKCDQRSISCRSCGKQGTVFPISDEQYRCLDCFQIFNEGDIHICEHCAEVFAGSIDEPTGFYGCGWCDGHSESDF